MEIATNQAGSPLQEVIEAPLDRKPRIDRAKRIKTPAACPVDFVPLNLETRTHVPTALMCWHLNRKAQTARGWACHEDGPLRPIRVCGRLAWAVADIRRLLGVA